jgi:hypothetical protein
MKVCLGCGAPQNLSKLNCEFCGESTQGNAGETYEEFINKFSKNFQALISDESHEISKSQSLRNFDGETKSDLIRTAAFINSLYIPADKNQLIQLAAFVMGQLNSSSAALTLWNVDERGGMVAAWIGKSSEVCAKLQLMGWEDAQLGSAGKLLEKCIQDASDRLARARKTVWFLLAGIVGLVVLGLIPMLYEHFAKN